MKKHKHSTVKRITDSQIEHLVFGIVDSHLRDIFGPDAVDKASEMISLFDIPEDVPATLGLKFYNESLDKLISKDTKRIRFPRKKEERERVMAAFRKYLRTFRAMVDRAIDGEKPTEEDMRILAEAISRRPPLRMSGKDERTGRFTPTIVILPLFKDILWLWVYWVWNEKIRVKRCKAKDCNKIFIPKRSGQKYCSVNCRTRAFHQRKRTISTQALDNRRN